jgi:hypothetical protein
LGISPYLIDHTLQGSISSCSVSGQTNDSPFSLTCWQIFYFYLLSGNFALRRIFQCLGFDYFADLSTDVEVSNVLASISWSDFFTNLFYVAHCMSLSLLINFAAIMLRIRTPRSFALTSPVPISQFDQSYVNLFTYSFIKCFLSVEHYWFPQFEYMITINSFHPFEDWVSWVVAQLLSGGRQIKTPANVNVYFYSFCRKGKKLTIVSSKSRNNFAISRNKLQSQSIVSNCCFNFYILNQYFTCRHHICATSSL